MRTLVIVLVLEQVEGLLLPARVAFGLCRTWRLKGYVHFSRSALNAARAQAPRCCEPYWRRPIRALLTWMSSTQFSRRAASRSRRGNCFRIDPILIFLLDTNAISALMREDPRMRSGDVSCWDHYASVKLAQQRRGLTPDEKDLWMAATALALGATLVSSDSDFRRIDVLSVLVL